MSHDAFLVVANTYSPFISATASGSQIVVLPAFGALWGTVVPAGEDTVIDHPMLLYSIV